MNTKVQENPLKLNLTWEPDNGEFTDTGNPNWKINHTPIDEYGFSHIIHNVKEMVEVAFVSPMFEEGNVWVALVMWEGCQEPVLVKGTISCPEHGVCYDELSEKLNAVFNATFA